MNTKVTTDEDPKAGEDLEEQDEIRHPILFGLGFGLGRTARAVAAVSKRVWRYTGQVAASAVRKIVTSASRRKLLYGEEIPGQDELSGKKEEEAAPAKERSVPDEPVESASSGSVEGASTAEDAAGKSASPDQDSLKSRREARERRRLERARAKKAAESEPESASTPAGEEGSATDASEGAQSDEENKSSDKEME